MLESTEKRRKRIIFSNQKEERLVTNLSLRIDRKQRIRIKERGRRSVKKERDHWKACSAHELREEKKKESGRGLLRLRVGEKGNLILSSPRGDVERMAETKMLGGVFHE